MRVELASTLYTEFVIKVQGRRERELSRLLCICSFVLWPARSLLSYVALHAKVGLAKTENETSYPCLFIIPGGGMYYPYLHGGGAGCRVT